MKVEVETIKVISRALESRVLAGTFNAVCLSEDDSIEKIKERIGIVENLRIMTGENSLFYLLIEAGLSILLSSAYSEEPITPLPS